MKVTLGATLFASLVSCATGVTVIETKRAIDHTKMEAAAASRRPELSPARRVPLQHVEGMNLYAPETQPCEEVDTRDNEVSVTPPALLMV